MTQPALAAPARGPLLGLLTAALLAGCPAPEGPAEPGEHPCAAAWDLGDTEAVYVDAVAEPTEATGALATPHVDLAAALQAALDAGQDTVALAAGDYSASAEQRRLLFGAESSGVTLVGCGPENTVLSAIEAAPVNAPSGTPPVLQSVIEVDAGAQAVSIRNLTARGGRSSILVHDGAGSETPIELRNVVVEDSVGAGLLVVGLDTSVRVIDVDVDGVVPEETGIHAWGVAVLGGGSVFNEPVGLYEFDGLTVTGATGAAIVVDHANATFRNTEVSGTSDIGGVLGRGIHVQSNASVELDGVVATGNVDTALFIHKPREVVIRDSSFAATGRGTVPGVDDAITGDGLVATAGSEPDDPPVPVEDRVVSIETTSFEDNARAGALVEGVTVEIGDGVTFTGNGLGADPKSWPLAPEDVDTLFFQGDVAVEGIEGQELGGDSGYAALDVNRGALDLSDAVP